MTDPARGDQAFLAGDNHQTWPEMTYGGALSFARRRYSRSLENVEVVVSGIEDVNDVKLLIDIGYDGFLIGERFMKSKNPGLSFKNFINELSC